MVVKVHSSRQQLPAQADTGALQTSIAGCFIESLYRRAAEAEAPLASLLAEKAAQALEQSQQAHRIAIPQVVSQVLPASALGKLLGDIDHRRNRAATAARKWDEGGDRGAATNNTTVLSDDMARRISISGESSTQFTDTHRPELTSVRLFRESLVKLSSDKLVSRIIKEAPENPGPLNPQMLVIRSLSTMRDLSPDYLNRFVAYVDTLQWLEQATVVKKTAANRSSAKKNS